MKRLVSILSLLAVSFSCQIFADAMYAPRETPSGITGPTGAARGLTGPGYGATGTARGLTGPGYGATGTARGLTGPSYGSTGATGTRYGATGATHQSVPSSQYQAGQIQWFTKYNEALDVAKQQNKPLVLFFTGSDWCGWCKKIDSEVFKDPEFVRTAGDRYVFVELDFPMNKMLPLDISEQNAQLKHKYGITGYPSIVVIQPNETFVAEAGYRPGGGKAYAEYLNSLLQK